MVINISKAETKEKPSRCIQVGHNGTSENPSSKDVEAWGTHVLMQCGLHCDFKSGLNEFLCQKRQGETISKKEGAEPRALGQSQSPKYKVKHKGCGREGRGEIERRGKDGGRTERVSKQAVSSEPLWTGLLTRDWGVCLSITPSPSFLTFQWDSWAAPEKVRFLFPFFPEIKELSACGSDGRHLSKWSPTSSIRMMKVALWPCSATRRPSVVTTWRPRGAFPGHN